MPQGISSAKQSSAGQPLPGKAGLYPIINRNKDVDKAKSDVFQNLKRECLRKGVLFEDLEFPADDSSLFYKQLLPFKLEWKRPVVSVVWLPRCISAASYMNSGIPFSFCVFYIGQHGFSVRKVT